MNMVKEPSTTCSLFWHSLSIETSVYPNYKCRPNGSTESHDQVAKHSQAFQKHFKGGKAIQHGYECPGWSEFSLL